jgi:hypothetical protein
MPTSRWPLHFVRGIESSLRLLTHNAPLGCCGEEIPGAGRSGEDVLDIYLRAGLVSEIVTFKRTIERR